MIRYIVYIALFGLVLTSCKDDEETVKEQQSEIDEQVILDYLVENNIPAIKDEESSVYYLVRNEGGEELPISSSYVKYNYSGYLLGGEAFVSGTENYLSMQTLQPLKNLKYGLDEIGRGGKVTIYLPSTLAYGSLGLYNSDETEYLVPPNTVVVFDVDLVDFR